jgi:hypothetical protein
MAKSHLTGNGMSESPVKSGQDGFNIPSHVTSYSEGEKTSPQVGRDNTDNDSRGKGTAPGKES